MTELRNNRPETEHKYSRPTTDQLKQMYDLPEAESKTAEKKKGKKKLLIGALAGVGIATTAAIAVIAPNVFANNSEEAPVAEPVSTTEVVGEGETIADPAAPEAEVSLEQQIEALSIPAGLDNETLAERYAELGTEWWNAGKSDTFLEDINAFSDETGKPFDEYYVEMGKTNAQIYAPAMYGPDWESNPVIVELVQNRIDANVANLRTYNKTAFTGSAEDIEGFKAWTQIDRVRPISSTEGSRLLEISYTNDDNSELNSVEDGSVSDVGIVSVEFTESNGKEYVTQTY